MSANELMGIHISRDDNFITVQASHFDLALLRSFAASTDRTALKHIRRVWNVDLPVARLLLRVVRDGRKAPVHQPSPDDDVTPSAGGLLRCESCGRMGNVEDLYWPKCCGQTMRWWTQAQIDSGEMPDRSPES